MFHVKQTTEGCPDSGGLMFHVKQGKPRAGPAEALVAALPLAVSPQGR